MVAARARRGPLPRLVVDPVFVASTGRTLVTGRDRRRLPTRAAPPRAGGHTQSLGGRRSSPGEDPASVRDTCRRCRSSRPEIHRMGAAWVLVKGGHLPGVEYASRHGTSVPRARRPLRRGAGSEPVLEGPRVDTGQHPRHRLHPVRGHRRAARPRRGAATTPSSTRRRSSAARSRARPAGGSAKGHGPLDPFGWSGPVRQRRTRRRSDRRTRVG